MPFSLTLSKVLRATALFAACAALSAAFAGAPSVMSETDALALDKKLFSAMIEADTRSLASLTAADFVYNHGDAHTDTKTEMLARMSSGIAKFLRIERVMAAAQPHDRETLVFAYPDVVIITGKAEFVVSMFHRPEQTARDRLTTLWARTPTGWKLKLWHATPFPDKTEH